MRMMITAVLSLMVLVSVDDARAEGLTFVHELAAPLMPGEQIDFVFVSDEGIVTRRSVGDPDGDGRISVKVPPDTASATDHWPDCWWVIWDIGDTQVHSTSGPMLVLKDLATGNSLSPEYPLADLEAIPELAVDQTFAVVDGLADELPMATIRAPGIPFDQITDEQWADPQAAFPLFTGTAMVKAVDNLQVFEAPTIPALSEWGMVVMVLLLLAVGMGTLLRVSRRRGTSGPRP